MNYSKPGSLPEQLKDYDFDELLYNFTEYMKTLEEDLEGRWVLELKVEGFKNYIYRYKNKSRMDAILEYMDNAAKIEKDAKEAMVLLLDVFLDAGLIEKKLEPVTVQNWAGPAFERPYYRLFETEQEQENGRKTPETN